MIDIHNHVIYKFDDGPKSLEESLEMLKMASDQGITDIFASSHFNEVIPQEVETQYFEKLSILQNEASNINLPINIHSGSELFYHFFLNKTIKQHKVCTFANLGKYILVEFSLFIMPTGVEDTIFKLSMNEIIPIIAHPERYPTILEQYEKAYDYLRFGALFQVNAGSVLGDFGKEVQKLSMWMLKKKLVHFLGSDAHTTKGKRIFKLKEAVDMLKDILDEEYIQNLTVKNPRKILDSEKIDKSEISEPGNDQDNSILDKIKKTFGISKKTSFVY